MGKTLRIHINSRDSSRLSRTDYTKVDGVVAKRLYLGLDGKDGFAVVRNGGILFTSSTRSPAMAYYGKIKNDWRRSSHQRTNSRVYSSVYFSRRPRATSVGYFDAFSANFASIAAATSTLVSCAISRQ